ncbi:MAG: hypothetical protein ACK5N8_05925 [Alphaproteobacteria bacterium]
MKEKDINNLNSMLAKAAKQYEPLAKTTSSLKIPAFDNLQSTMHVMDVTKYQFLENSDIQNAIRISENFRESFLSSDIVHTISQINQQYQQMMAPFVEYQKMWQKSMEPFLKYQETLQNLTKQFINPEVFGKIQLRSVLLHNYWTIMDSELLNKLSSLSDMDSVSIENAVWEHYSENGFDKLENLLNKYMKDEEIIARKSIFTNCLEIMRKFTPQNAASVVIPTLLSQLSYFYDSLYMLIPIEERKKIKKQLKQETEIKCPLCDGKKPNDCKFVNPHKPHNNREIFLQHLEQTSSIYVYYYYKEVISKTFDNGKKIEKNADNYTKYRNKVLHGEELEYGTLGNLIRCWLELMFLFDLRKNYRDNKGTENI